MPRRRTFLLVVASSLMIADSAWLFMRPTESNATITYVGFDSLSVTVPARMKAAQLRDGKWDINPFQPLHPSGGDSTGDSVPPLAYVSLAPLRTYGAATDVIRDLKQRQVCNVVIRESGVLSSTVEDFPGGRDHGLTMDALVLCGRSIGDAGFTGQLPPDGPVSLEQ